jgi:hydroxymethylpyrimidine/phosphomethylpyrimidine kinase
LVGAGVFADVVTISELGAHPLAVVTALVTQDSNGVRAWESAPSASLVMALQCALADGRPDAIKTGMLGTPETLSAVAKQLALHAIPDTWVISDPVLASGGDVPMAAQLLAETFARTARRLAKGGLRVLLTPNVAELGALTGAAAPASLDDLRKLAQRLAEAGDCCVLAKGGHLSDSVGTDVLVHLAGVHEFSPLPWPESSDIHGTGCALSSALAVELARGTDLADAVRSAREVLAVKARACLKIGVGRHQLGRFVRS